MGHYSDCYEQDARVDSEKRDKAARKELIRFSEEMSVIDKELLVQIAKNIDDFKSAFALIRRFIKE